MSKLVLTKQTLPPDSPTTNQVSLYVDADGFLRTKDDAGTITNYGAAAGDHGDLTGLADDDHPQYLLVNGSRAMLAALQMGGFDITGVNLVDSRDVSTDGAKLDGIEASADVTDATNVAAAGAVMDTDFVGTNIGTLIRTAAATYGVLQHNLTAIAGPSVNDDTTVGYAAGSLWVDATANQVYHCADAAAGAAVWRQAGAAGVIDHGALTGLADDDHPQYLLVDGSRAMTGPLAMGGQAITGVGNVDGRDVSADGTTLDAHVAASNPHAGSLSTAHEGAGGAVHALAVASGAAGFMSGADKTKLDGVATGATATPLASATPAAVGTAAVGVATDAARADHVHAHGNQRGGALHADAVAGVSAGFMSAADKTKLNGIATAAVADHGALTGLADDDHTQYLRTDGTRVVPNFLDFAEGAVPALPGAATSRLFATARNGFGILNVQGDDGFDIELGRDSVAIVRNTSGSSMAKGVVVAIVGSTGQTPNVDLADASDPALAGFAVTIDTIANNAFGRVLMMGILRDVDTSAWAEGTQLYVSATVPGGLTSTQPTHPDLSERVGIVLNQSAPNGIIGVDIHDANGDEYGTRENDFKIGSNTAGTKTITFRNGFDLSLSATPTATRAIVLPDASGTVVLSTEFTSTHVFLARQGGAGPVAVAVPLSSFVGRIASGDIIGMTTAQAKTLLAYAATEVSFAANGDIAATTVQAAIVEVRDDADTKLASKASIAGQLGGTGALPDVRGVRETAGPTLLTFGAIADGQNVRRVGNALVGVAPGGAIDTISGFVADVGTPANRRGYTHGSDPISATLSFTACVLCFPLDSTFVSSTSNTVFGTFNGVAGGWAIRWSQGDGWNFVFFDNTTVSRTGGFFAPLNVRKLAVVHMRVVNVGAGSPLTIQLFINGAQVAEVFNATAGGTYMAGSNLCIGPAAEGAVLPAYPGRLHGAGYITSAITPAAIANHAEACIEAAELVDPSTPFTDAWKVTGGQPTTTWASWKAGATLTALGAPTALTVATKASPLLWA